MENIFERKNSFRVYIGLSIPLVLSLAVSIIYGLADTYFVSATQDTLLVAGVSVCTPLFMLLMALGNVFAQGGCSLISRMLGSKDYEGLKKVTAFSFYASIFTGILSGFLLIIFNDTVLYALGANEETFFYAKSYYMILSLGAPFIAMSFVPSNQLRAEGLSKESMAGTIIGAMLNIILDPIFISVLGLGAAGAAAASVIGYIASDIYFIVVILRKSKCYCLDPREMFLRRDWAAQSLALGLSNGLTNIMQSFCQVIMNHFLLAYGNDKIAAMGIALKVNNIAILILIAFAFSAQPIVGYLYGAGQSERLNKLIKQIFIFLGTLGAVLTVMIMAAAPWLMSIFLKDPEIISAGAHMIRILSVSMIFMIAEIYIMIIFVSVGKAVQAIVLSTSRQGYLFVILILIFSVLWGYEGILVTQAAADVLSFLLAAVLIRKTLFAKRKNIYDSTLGALSSDEFEKTA